MLFKAQLTPLGKLASYIKVSVNTNNQFDCECMYIYIYIYMLLRMIRLLKYDTFEHGTSSPAPGQHPWPRSGPLAKTLTMLTPLLRDLTLFCIRDNIYIYIYIERERYTHMYIYIYIERERDTHILPMHMSNMLC